MKLRETVKAKLLEPRNTGYFMWKTGHTYTTVKRWIETSYKDLRLPEYEALIREIVNEEILFE